MRLSSLANTILGLAFACALIHAEPVTITPTVSGKGVVLGGGTVESGTDFTLRAIPEVDWRFDHWEGTPRGQSQENPITLTAASGLQPTAVMLSADGTGRFAGAPVVVIPTADENPPETNVPPIFDAIAVSAEARNALALRRNGSVVSWDISSAGELAVPTGLTNIVSIYAGTSHHLAVRADGTVVGWGSNTSGQTNVPDGLTNVVAVAAGSAHSVALRNDGLVVAWGNNGLGQTNVPAGLRNVIAISASANYTIALKADGSVVAWGFIMVPSGDYIPAAPPASFTNLVAISSSFNYNLGVTTDGRVAQWGYLDGLPSGLPPGLTNVVAAAAGRERGLAILSDRTMQPWGRGEIDPPYAAIPGVIAAEPGTTSLVTMQGDGFGFIQPDRSTVFVEDGEAVRLAPVTTGGQSFQWFRNGQAVAGANSASLFIASATVADAGSYSVAVINGTNAVATPTTIVNVVPAGYPRVLVNGMEVRDTARLSGPAQITLTTTLAAPQIFYTLDGSTPTFSSRSYTAPFTLNQTTNVTIRALAISGDFSRQATNTPVNIAVLPSYTLTVNVSGPGHVDLTPKLTRYFPGDVVSLNAFPNTNATFTTWSGALTGTNPAQQITINSNTTVTANFQDAPKYTATIVDGGGTITVNPSGPQYAGTDVTISAAPNPGWQFRDWTGDHTGTETSFVWHVEGPATFKANFDTTIGVTSAGPGHILLDPDLPRYLYGTRVRVIPVAEFGNELVLWGQDAAGQSLGEWTLTVTNAAPKISALFQASSPPAYQFGNVQITNGEATIHISGSAGTNIKVQATEDFVSWTDLKTMTIGSSGFDDQLQLAIPQPDAKRFYRVVQVP